MFLWVGCSQPGKCLILSPSFCEAVLERTESLSYSFNKLLFSTCSCSPSVASVMRPHGL